MLIGKRSRSTGKAVRLLLFDRACVYFLNNIQKVLLMCGQLRIMKVPMLQKADKVHSIYRVFGKGAYIMAKSANLYARIEPEVKEQAERILSALGIPASNAINMFYKQIILHGGIPFDVKIPSAGPADMSSLSETRLNQELEKGYADMQAGRTKNAGRVFADIRRDYGL